ncbi:hypothetical protein JXM67_00705 [candidate division WOR-3 bacterium]|nr:hypothetical protein [candidate division WOR-3 bacterium]
MEPNSFNLNVINIFAGLMKGHKFLRPHSTKIKKLGYTLFRVEMDITVPSLGTTRVDGIGQSVQQRHTILAEWTSRNMPGVDKERQIEKYLSVTADTLSAVGGVNREAATQNSTWLILSPGSENNYMSFLNEKTRDKLMISTFGVKQSSDNGATYGLVYFAGESQDSELANILKEDIKVRRLPQGYVKVSIDDTSLKGLANEVVVDIKTHFVRGKYEVSEEDIIRGVYKELWRYIGPRAKHDIVKGIRGVLKEMLRKNYLRDWIQRISENPHVWKIMIPEKKDINLVGRQFRITLEKFIAEVYGKSPRQKELFEEIDDTF